MPERKEAIENVALIGGRIVAQYSSTCRAGCRCSASTARRRARSRCPGAGTVGAMSGREDAPTSGNSFRSPLMPSTVYVFDPATKTSEGFEIAKPPVDNEPVRDERRSSPRRGTAHASHSS